MQYMPLFVSMANKKVLFIGGGNVAYRKAKQFSDAGTKIKVIAPAIKKELKDLPHISFEERKALSEDISDKYFAVIFASSDKETNEKLSKICEEKRILFDRCDEHEKGDFVTGSVITSCNIINATVSGGVPTLSRFLKQEIKTLFTPELEKLNKLLLDLRPSILASNKLGSSYLVKLVNKETLQKIKKEGIDSLKQEILACL